MLEYTVQLECWLIILNLERVIGFNEWKSNAEQEWHKIRIIQKNNLRDVTIDAGNRIEVGCKVILPNINPDNISVQVYSAKIMPDGSFEDIQISTMVRNPKEENLYTGSIELKTGGDYGYTFRVMPKNEMLLEPADLNLVKWLEKDENDDISEEEKKEVEDIVNELGNV